MVDKNDLISSLEQYRHEGGDMSPIAEVVQLLASTGKTSLGLNQWVKSDKPMMEDFNEDNRIIDAELQKKVDKVQIEEKPLPLVEGFTGAPYAKNTYAKSMDGFVTVNANVTGSFRIGNATCAILPEGYRPQDYLYFSTAAFEGESSSSPARIAFGALAPDGRLAVNMPNGVTGFAMVAFSISFYAGND